MSTKRKQCKEWQRIKSSGTICAGLPPVKGAVIKDGIVYIGDVVHIPVYVIEETRNACSACSLKGKDIGGDCGALCHIHEQGEDSSPKVIMFKEAEGCLDCENFFECSTGAKDNTCPSFSIELQQTMRI